MAASLFDDMPDGIQVYGQENRYRAKHRTGQPVSKRIVFRFMILSGYRRFTPDPDTLELYAHAVEYISTLDGPAFDGFWLTRKLANLLTSQIMAY